MSKALLFKNGSIATETDALPVKADVLVENGRIQAVDTQIPASEQVEVIDCSDKIIIPGLFDIHVHLREPGQEGKETIETGSRSALNGGVTGVVAMPNTDPAIDSGGLVRYVLAIAKEKAVIPVYTTGCVTKGRAGKELAEIADMVENGALMITDDGSPIDDPYVFRRALEYARNYDLPVACHCETMTLTAGGAMNEGAVSYKLGVPGVPSISEELCIDRDIRIAQYVDAHVHIQHVSSAKGMEIIRRFKNEGVKVTCEVSPHHLIFNETGVGDYDTNYKMSPPLRTAEDNALLLEGLKEGVFDVIATDHAPHTPFEKGKEFAAAPNGIIGLDSALLSLYDRFIKPGAFGWDLLVKRYSAEPRRIIKHDVVNIEKGNAAEFIVFDPNASTTISKDFIKSKSINTPHINETLSGSVEKVILAGEIKLDRLATGASA